MIVTELKGWMTEGGLLGEKGIATDNDILNFANYLLGIRNNTGSISKELRELAVKFLQANGYPDVKYSNNSHDNHVGVISVCILCDLPLPSISVRRYWEPRVFIFDKLIRHGGIWWLLYPILLGIMIVSAITTKKVRPTFYQKKWWDHLWLRIRYRVGFIKETQRIYTNKNEETIVVEAIKTWAPIDNSGWYFTRRFYKSDGKILTLHRLHALGLQGHNMRLSWKIVMWCMKRTISGYVGQSLMGIFYRQNDPIFKAWGINE